MEISSPKEFVTLLEKSNLLTEDRLKKVRRALAKQNGQSEPRAIARELVRHDYITLWQAQQLLAGRHTFFLGRYKLLERIGEGGMGAVFRAQQEPMGRIVAIKVMAKRLLRNPDAVARFEREVQSAAALNHPNIVAAFDAGQVGETYFLVMEYVDGKNLNQWLGESHPLPVPWVCECIRQTAIGLYSAHSQGMVHRDIKPGNLLVTAKSVRTYPTVKLSDMGLARMFTALEDQDELTQTGQILGTPDYIAPEQARNTHQADPRSDIFSLGCTLYKLLTRQLPFGGNNAMEKLMARATESPRAASTVRGDIPLKLDAVLLKMLQRNPDRRYQDCQQLAHALSAFCMTKDQCLAEPADETAFTYEDAEEIEAEADTTLNEFLNVLANEADEDDTITFVSGPGKAAPQDTGVTLEGEPLEPTADTPQLWLRQAWRTKWLAPAAAAVLLLIVLVAAGGQWWAGSRPPVIRVNWPITERDSSKLQIDGENYPLDESNPFSIELDPGKHRLVAWRRGFEPYPTEVELDLGQKADFVPQWKKVQLAAPRELPQPGAKEKGPLAPLERKLEEASQASAADLKEFRAAVMAHYRDNFGTRTAREALALLSHLPSPLDPLPLKPKLAKDAPGSEAVPVITVLDQGPTMSHWNAVTSLAFGKGGEYLASGSKDHQIRFWDVSSGESRKQLGQTGPVAALTLSPDGKVLAAGGTATPVQLFQFPEGNPLQELSNPRAVTDLEFSAGGDKLVVIGEDNSVWVYNARNPQAEPVHWMFDGGLHAVAIRPDGKQVAAGTAYNSVVVWNAETGELLHTLTGHTHRVDAVQYSPDGKLLASGSWDHLTKIWNPETGELLRTFEGHQGPVHALAFSPGGTMLATAGEDDRILLWSLEYPSRKPRGLPGAISDTRSLAFHPEGHLLAAGDETGAIQIWDVATARVRRNRTEYPLMPTSIALSPNGKTLAVGGGGAAVQCWNLLNGEIESSLWGHSEAVEAIAVDASNRMLASASLDHSVKLWDLQSGEEMQELTGHTDAVVAVAISPDGSKIATGGRDRSVKIWDAKTGQELLSLDDHADRITDLAFSARGELLASASDDKTIKVWDMTTGDLKFNFDKHAAGIVAIAFSPVENMLSSRSDDGEVKVWNASTGEARFTIDAHAGSGGPVAFRPDGRVLATAGMDGMVRLWDAEEGQVLRRIPVGPSGGRIRQLGFSPDGRYLTTLNGNQSIYLLRLRDHTLDDWSVARWVLRRGGKIELQTGDTGEQLQLQQLRLLPQEPFYVQKIDLSSTKVNSRDLKRIAGLKHMRHLVLSNTGITDPGLTWLRNAQQLRRLDLHNTRVTPAGIGALREFLPDCQITQ